MKRMRMARLLPARVGTPIADASGLRLVRAVLDSGTVPWVRKMPKVRASDAIDVTDPGARDWQTIWDEVHIWKRQPFDDDHSWALFLRYLYQPTPKGTPVGTRRLPDTSPHTESIAIANRWHRRATEFDLFVATEMARIRATSLLRQLDAANLAVEVGTRELAAINRMQREESEGRPYAPGLVTVPVALRCIDRGIAIERTLEGAVVPPQDGAGASDEDTGDLGALSADELETYAALVAKMRAGALRNAPAGATAPPDGPNPK